MAWLYLCLAGLFEVGWVVGLKSSQGFTRLWPSVATVLSMSVSLFLLGLALRSLPMGTAYAIWTGIGAVGAILIGIVAYGESTNLMRMICAGMIVAGIVGLKITSR